MRFEVGKFYKHSGGRSFRIIAESDLSIVYQNPLFVGESPDGSAAFVGNNEDSTLGFEEITQDEYMTEFDELGEIPEAADVDNEVVMIREEMTAHKGRTLFGHGEEREEF